jgi:CRP-like cAMP-binding protein
MASANIDRLGALRRVTLFRSLSDSELGELAQNSLIRKLRRDEPLVFEGEAAAGLLVLVQGSVRLFREAMDGREQVIRIEHAVATLNELQLIDTGQHPASISACEESLVISLHIAQCRQKLADSPRFALDVLEKLAQRLRYSFDLIDSLSLLAVDQRLAQFLLDQAQVNGRVYAHGLRVELTMSNQQIGSIIGAVREVVSRSMSKLQRCGFISVWGRTVMIPDERVLSEFAATGRENRDRKEITAAAG